MVEQRVFTEVSVAGAPPVSFCVDPSAGDPVAAWFLEQDWIDEPVQRVFVGLVEPGMRVLDLGSHLGTFALPAAAMGAEVLAVDGSPEHVRLLRAAAERNGFTALEVVYAAVAPPGHPETISFVPQSIHGHVQAGHIPVAQAERAKAIEVPAATVDTLLQQHGWDTVDLVKMDIEGAEPWALAGMERLYANGSRPLIVFECNGGMLPLLGSSVPELRDRLAQLGYQLWLIDHMRPGVLVEATADTLQPECVSDCLAAAARPEGLARQWRIEPELGREALLTRLLDSAASEGSGYRAYAAHLMVDGPDWLRSAPETRAALSALAHDLDGHVRNAVAPDHERSWAVETMLSPEPPARGRPADIRVWAEGVSLRQAPGGLEPLHAPSPPSPVELLVTDAWVHVRSGQLVGVVADEPAVGSGFLRLLAGREEPTVGQLELQGPSTTLSPLCAGLELGLSVVENIMVLGEGLGLAESTVAGGIDRIIELAEVDGPPGVTLEQLPALTAAKLVLATTLGLAEPALLFLDAIPGALPGRFSEWLRERISALRGAGSAVVQLVTDDEELLGAPDRIVWIAAGRAQASGHPGSVLEAYDRHRLGLSELPLDRRPSLAMQVPR
jgi:FkbM family methyltransferase